jgi:hypothetical protein
MNCVSRGRWYRRQGSTGGVVVLHVARLGAGERTLPATVLPVNLEDRLLDALAATERGVQQFALAFATDARGACGASFSTPGQHGTPLP